MKEITSIIILVLLIIALISTIVIYRLINKESISLPSFNIDGMFKGDKLSLKEVYQITNDKILDNNIDYVIDLRTDEEYNLNPNKRFTIRGALTINIPFRRFPKTINNTLNHESSSGFFKQELLQRSSGTEPRYLLYSRGESNEYSKKYGLPSNEAKLAFNMMKQADYKEVYYIDTMFTDYYNIRMKIKNKNKRF